MRKCNIYFIIFISLMILTASPSFAEFPPTGIKADILEYTGGIYSARGNVVINQANRVLKSSELTLDNNSGELIASGSVELEDGGNHLSSDNLFFNIRTSYTSINNGKMFIKEDNYHIEGEKIERVSEDRYRIKKANFTTCDGDPPCWKFRGNNINIHLNHIFTARHVSLSVKNFPVLYLPYIALPIIKERQTGLLIPRVGYNTGEGLKVNNAFFWAISDSKDATIYADYYGEKGWGSGLEYRYLYSRDTGGQFNGYYLNDNELKRERWNIKYQHRQQIAEDFSAKLRINHLNDETLYKDISEDVGERLQRTQDSDLYISRRWDSLSSHLWTQYTQNLSGDSAGIYQRLPEVSVRLMDTRMGTLPLYYSLASTASRWEEEDTGLARFYLAPELSARFSHKGVVIVPRAGVEQTFYYYDGDTAPVNSNLYNIGVSASANFFRSFNTDNGDLLHFIEPVLAYEYADGDKVEGGSTRLDLVEENTEKNRVSFSLINRIISMRNERRFEPLYLRVAQLYHINNDSPGSLNRRLSDTRVEGILRFNDIISLDADTLYSHDDNDFVYFNTDFKIKGDNSYFNAGQRYSKDSAVTPSIEFFTAEAGIERKSINTSIAVWYDNKDHVMRETNYVIRYIEQCWGVSFSYKYRPDEKQFSVLLTLKGVGSVGKM